MNYDDFLVISGFLDPLEDQGSVLVEADRLNRIPSDRTRRLSQLFFGERNQVLLTRKDVLRSRRGNVELFLLSVLFWGFPLNQRGRCARAFNNWDRLVAMTNQIRRHPEMSFQDYEGFFRAMNAMGGLGISTFSKIFYFLQASIDGYPCLIMDNLVARGISRLEGDEFIQIHEAADNGRHRYYANYPRYLEAARTLALMGGIPEHNIEYTLWLAGKKNR